jgi:hypothetical protein
MRPQYTLAGALLIEVAACAVSLSVSPAHNVSKPLLESFVSYSIEFSSFPDFAGRRCNGAGENGTKYTPGNSSQPNNFSYNLLTNLRNLQGSFPIIRVGGNTE